MNRRELLAALAASTSGVAGCNVREVGGSEDATSASPEARPTTVTAESTDTTPGSSPTVVETPSIASLGFPETICSAEVLSEFHIRAIVDPAFGPDWDGVEVADRYSLGFEGPGLADDAPVVGVVRDGRSRAYPVSVVWWHEVVNDRLGGPLLVTYCPICSSGMVAERLVAGDETVFGVSGQLWQPPGEYAAASIDDGTVFGASASDVDAEARNSGNLVLYDEATRSFWSQLLARAICGPQAGEELTLVPATVTSWGAWRAERPETDVLLPPPASTLM
jgi:hypothetical protein